MARETMLCILVVT